jgi:ATP-dependent Lon protease
MIRTYLDWLIAVPWGKRSETSSTPSHAREVLDADQPGLEDVKDRIQEYRGRSEAAQDRQHRGDKRSGAILP